MQCSTFQCVLKLSRAALKTLSEDVAKTSVSLIDTFNQAVSLHCCGRPILHFYMWTPTLDCSAFERLISVVIVVRISSGLGQLHWPG